MLYKIINYELLKLYLDLVCQFLFYCVVCIYVLVGFRPPWDLDACPFSPMLITRHVALSKISRRVMIPFKLRTDQAVRRIMIVGYERFTSKPNLHLNLVVRLGSRSTTLTIGRKPPDKDGHFSFNSNDDVRF